MSKRSVFHVVPTDIGWRVVYEASRIFKTKSEALRDAKTAAKAAGLGQVKVHGRNGRIQTEYTYGKDPKRFKG